MEKKICELKLEEIVAVVGGVRTTMVASGSKIPTAPTSTPKPASSPYSSVVTAF